MNVGDDGVEFADAGVFIEAGILVVEDAAVEKLWIPTGVGANAARR